MCRSLTTFFGKQRTVQRKGGESSESESCAELTNYLNVFLGQHWGNFQISIKQSKIHEGLYSRRSNINDEIDD